jgi:hypothetical protein
MNPDDLAAHLLRRLHEVQARLHLAPAGDVSACFADVIDSMGLVEFIGQVAEDCGVESETIERAAGRRFSTVAALAQALHTAGLVPGGQSHKPEAPAKETGAPRAHKPEAQAMGTSTAPHALSS